MSPNFERLLRVIYHLEKEKLGHDKFNFSVLTGGKRRKNGCGTQGCALGELPMIFPKDFKFRQLGRDSWTVVNMNDEMVYTNFFGLNTDMIRLLFYPYTLGHDGLEAFNGKLQQLPCDASKMAVARNIRSFITLWKAENYLP